MTLYQTDKLTFFVMIAFIISSCGGIGKIKAYEYNMTKVVLEKQINIYYSKHPELNKANKNPIYNLDGTGYEDDYRNCYLQVGKDTFIYTFSFIGDSIYWATHAHSEILLRNASKYGEILKINSELGFFEKRKFVKFFEKYFIDKLAVKPIATE